MSRRLVRVPVDLQVWRNILTQDGYSPPFKCTKGLPKDAELVSNYFDGSNQLIYFIFYHESFSEIGDAEVIPEFRSEYKFYHPRNWTEVELEL